MTKKVQRIKTDKDVLYRFHGETHVLRKGDHVAEEVFAKFGPQVDGQPMSGWLEAAHSVAKQSQNVTLYIETLDLPDPVDPRDARIAELEARLREAEARCAAGEGNAISLTPQPEGGFAVGVVESDAPVYPGPEAA